MRAAVQLLTRRHQMQDFLRDYEWRSGRFWQEHVWEKAVHRVVTEGLSPEQAVNEATARIMQLLSE